MCQNLVLSPVVGSDFAVGSHAVFCNDYKLLRIKPSLHTLVQQRSLRGIHKSRKEIIIDIKDDRDEEDK